MARDSSFQELHEPGINNPQSGERDAADALSVGTAKPEETNSSSESQSETSDADVTSPPLPPHPHASQKKNLPSKFSISDVLSGADKEDSNDQTTDTNEAEPRPGLPENSFTQNQLNDLWKHFLDKLLKQGKNRLHGSLSNKELEKLNHNTIGIVLGNQVQQSALHEIKPELLPYLREKLQHFYLHIEVQISPEDDASKLEPYSDAERFEYFAAKNPKIAELKKRLGMDFD